jgi:Mannosyl-glycoprotein endo-beta-N-acetylglucosaminidase
MHTKKTAFIIKSATAMVATVLLSFGKIQAQQQRLTAEEVFKYICEKDIAHPDIVIRQAILETGWFKAPFLMSRNNIFGFRSKKYLHFDNWKDCVDYYKKWQDKRYKDPNEDYYKFLLRVKYATSSYPARLKKVRYDNSCPPKPLETQTQAQPESF